MSPSFSPCAGLASVFRVIFVLCLNSLPFGQLSETIGKLSLYFNRLYIGIAMSSSSTFSMSLLLICDMHDLNRALFLNTAPLCVLSLFPSTARSIILLQQYTHHYSHTNLVLALEFYTLYSSGSIFSI